MTPDDAPQVAPKKKPTDVPLGSGMADRASLAIQSRQDRIDAAVAEASGGPVIKKKAK